MPTPSILMEHTKSTKGTHVYTATGTAIETLYIKREGLPTPPPRVIKVTIEEAP